MAKDIELLPFVIARVNNFRVRNNWDIDYTKLRFPVYSIPESFRSRLHEYLTIVGADQIHNLWVNSGCLQIRCSLYEPGEMVDLGSFGIESHLNGADLYMELMNKYKNLFPVLHY